jgi:hypothetical protein
VRELTQPTVHHIDRSRAEDDPDVRATIAEQAAADQALELRYAARSDTFRAQHAAARTARHAAGARRALERLRDNEQGRAQHAARAAARAAARRATITRLPSMLEQLQDAVHSTQGGGGASAGPHRSPIGLAAAELLHSIDRACSGCPGATLTDRLRYWAGLSGVWRTQAPQWLLLRSLDAQQWVTQGWEILDPSRVTPIPGMCPRCRRRTVRAPDDLGEWVERPVLNLARDEGTVHCTAPCREAWGPDRLRWLGELLAEQDVEAARAAELGPSELQEAG